MNITSLQSTLAPILAPIAPAVLFGNNLHAGMIHDGINPTLALAASVLGTGGVELSGALACSMAVLAYHKRDYKVMGISTASAFIYALFVMMGILQSRNTGTFASAVVISLVAYLMQGVWQSYNNKIRMAQAETDLQVRSMDAERKLVNSQTRNAKVSGKLPETFRNTGRTDWRLVPAGDKAKIAGMSTREISDAYRVSERTARNWKQYAEEDAQ